MLHGRSLARCLRPPLTAADPRSPVAAAHGGCAAPVMAAVRASGGAPGSGKPPLSPASVLPLHARRVTTPQRPPATPGRGRHGGGGTGRPPGFSARGFSATSAAAALASAWALLAVPLTRTLGRSLDPGSCPDRCLGAVFLPLVALGPLFAGISFTLTSQATARVFQCSLRRAVSLLILLSAAALGWWWKGSARWWSTAWQALLDGPIAWVATHPATQVLLSATHVDRQILGAAAAAAVGNGVMLVQPVAAVTAAAAAYMAAVALGTGGRGVRSARGVAAQRGGVLRRLPLLAVRAGLLAVAVAALGRPREPSYTTLLPPHDLESHAVSRIMHRAILKPYGVIGSERVDSGQPNLPLAFQGYYARVVFRCGPRHSAYQTLELHPASHEPGM